MSSGGSVFSMTLNGGATEFVYFSGTATSTTVSSGFTVNSGDTLDVPSGGISNASR